MNFAAIAALITSIVTRIWPDKSELEKQKFAAEVTQILTQKELELKALDVDTEQTKTNTEQVKSTSLFVSGPRPYIMWGLGTILILYGFSTVIINILVATGMLAHAMPPLDSMLRDVILGLLGLGYITRSYDKKQETKK